MHKTHIFWDMNKKYIDQWEFYESIELKVIFRNINFRIMNRNFLLKVEKQLEGMLKVGFRSQISH